MCVCVAQMVVKLATDTLPQQFTHAHTYDRSNASITATQAYPELFVCVCVCWGIKGPPQILLGFYYIFWWFCCHGENKYEYRFDINIYPTHIICIQPSRSRISVDLMSTRVLVSTWIFVWILKFNTDSKSLVGSTFFILPHSISLDHSSELSK